MTVTIGIALRLASVPIPIGTMALAGLLAIGSALCLIGIRGRLVRDRGRCSACRHLVHDPTPAQCPECGVPFGRDAIVWGIVRTRRCLLVSGVVMLVAAVPLWRSLAASVSERPSARQRASARAVAALPVEELQRRLESAGTAIGDWNRAVKDGTFTMSDAARAADVQAVGLWHDVDRAIQARLLDEERLIVVGRSAALFLAASSRDGGAMPGIIPQTYTEIVAGEMLDSEGRRRLIAALVADAEVIAPRVVHVDAWVPLEIDTLSRQIRAIPGGRLSVPVVRIDVVSVRRDGQEWQDFRATPRAPGVFDEGEHWSVRLERLGPAELEVALEATVEHGDHSTTVTLEPRSVNIEVLAADEPLPMPIHDPETAAEIREAISGARIALGLEPCGAQWRLGFAIDVAPPRRVGISFDVVVDLGDNTGEGVPVGRISAVPIAHMGHPHALSQSRGPIRHTMSGTIDSVLGVIGERATIRLIPRLDSHILSRVAVTGVWAETMVIDDVPIERIDRRAATVPSRGTTR